MKNKIKRKVRLFFKGGLAFLCGGWRNLLEQLSGLLEEVGVLLESLGSLLENRRSPWQEVCSFSYIRAGEEGHRVLLEQLCRLLEKGGRY